MTDAFIEYCSLLTKLHLLIIDGQGDTNKADKLRDEMDKPLRDMTLREDKKARELSAHFFVELKKIVNSHE